MEVDKVNFEARQRMLALRDQTHAQEAALKREVAVTTRSTQLQDDALRQMERQLKLKEATLEEYRSQCDSKVRPPPPFLASQWVAEVPKIADPVFL